MFPYGNGFNTINHREYHIIEANILTLSLMKRKLKLAGHNYFWIWIAIKSGGKTILGNYISSERNMLIAERFLN
jgi:transposase-like protein